MQGKKKFHLSFRTVPTETSCLRQPSTCVLLAVRSSMPRPGSQIAPDCPTCSCSFRFPHLFQTEGAMRLGDRRSRSSHRQILHRRTPSSTSSKAKVDDAHALCPGKRYPIHLFGPAPAQNPQPLLFANGHQQFPAARGVPAYPRAFHDTHE